MKRRAFLAYGACLAAMPALSQPRRRRLGVLQWPGGMMNRDKPGGIAFVAAMKELGYVEDRDYIFDERVWPKPELAVPVARELVEAKPDVIIAAGPPSIVAARAATKTIPIVMMYSAEPVAMGIVQSLARPGANITGLAWDHGFETSLKTIEILKEALPKMQRVAVLWDGTDSAHPRYAAHFEKGTALRSLDLVSLELRGNADIESAFARMRRERAEAMVVLPSAQITIPHSHAIMSLAVRGRHPTLVNYVGREQQFAGAFLFYGPNLERMPRRAAAYVDRIFKGAKPAEIPVEQPDKYDLIVDAAAARHIGLQLPQSLLLRADKVIG